MKTTQLGRKVKIKLIELGMTQRDLAKKFNTSPQNLNGVLTGTSSSLQLEEALTDWVRKPKSKKRTSSKSNKPGRKTNGRK